ncbi:DUF4190 domain-containing protein [Kitasatospora sp. NPDC004745]|uniref:DUF4190 domain-containing protein n=1 Tax=unclassified Kitasatospora TaxID=2633591 RepID=UPI00368699D0
MSTVTEHRGTATEHRGTDHATEHRGTATDRAGAEADNLAVASFLLGLPGLLIFNIALGPLAIVLATLALVRGTRRRGRALLGLALGIASLAILTVTTVSAHGVLMDFGS